MRIGQGYDVHRLTEGRRLVLGGVEIAYEKGLLGHSDADVLTHAVMNAVLGALGAGDIGRVFPDTDERYRDISSMLLLAEVAGIMADKGFAIGNIDATVIAQKPKLASYMDAMAANIARALNTEPVCVSVKAATEEGLGFTGGGAGIAAHAVCLLE